MDGMRLTEAARAPVARRGAIDRRGPGATHRLVGTRAAGRSNAGTLDILFVTRNAGVARFFSSLIAASALRARLVRPAGFAWPDFSALRSLPWPALRRLAALHGEIRRRQTASRWRLATLAPVYDGLILLRAAFGYGHALGVLRRLRPRAVGVWNGTRFPDALYALAARELGVRTVFFELGCLPNTLCIDARGVNAASSVPRDPAFYRDLPEPPALDRTMYARPRRLGSAGERRALPPRYLFAPLQVRADTQVLANSPWLRDTPALYGELVALQWRLRAADSDLRIVIKEHPSDRAPWRELAWHAARDGMIVANGNPTPELIAGAAGVITLNSSVGIEALLLDKKVIVLGEALYAIPGLVQTARDAAALYDAVAGLDAWRADQALRRRFLHWLGEEYCVRRFAAPPASIDGLKTQGGEDWVAIVERLERLVGAPAGRA